MSKPKPEKEKSHGQVFRMEAVYYPAPGDTDLVNTLYLKHSGDAKKWADELNVTLEDELFKPFCKKWIWQLEQGEEKGKYHCQMYFELYAKQRCPTLAGAIGGKLKGITIREASIAGTNAVQYYCAKEKTRKAGPYSNMNLAQVSAPSGWDLKEIEAKPFPWQQTIIDLVRQKCTDDRVIHWIYDKQGCSGKTKLTKYLTHLKIAIPVQYGSARDLMNIVFNNKGANCYLFDLTRAKPESMPGDDIYSTMEAAKNGMVQNTKYETGITTFDPPHMIVFANVKPEFKKLTQDRWRVWCIDEKAELVQWKDGQSPKSSNRTMSAGLNRSSSLSQKASKSEIDRKHAMETASTEPQDDTGMETEPLSTAFISAAEMLRQRRARWDRYWKAVSDYWVRKGMAIDGETRGVSCVHNVFGCDDCEALYVEEDDTDPPRNTVVIPFDF